MVMSQTATDAKVTATELRGYLSWYSFVNPAKYPPGTSDTDNLSQSDVQKAKFVGFALSGTSNTPLNLSAPFCCYVYTSGSVVLHAKKGTGMVQVTFAYMVHEPTFNGDRRVRIMNLKYEEWMPPEM
jgi:hypothetical protein